MNRFLRVFLLLSAALMLVLVIGWRPSVAQTKGEYVGSDTCLNCHDTQARTLAKSPHWKKAVKDSPINGQGCESCHGPGSAHAEAGGGKGVGGLITFSKKESADRRSGICLRCHENSTQVAMWETGVHKKKEVGCSDCHSIHRSGKKPFDYGYAKVDFGYSPGRQYQICGACHADVKTRFNRRSHHPLIEGKITCSNCHDPHGNMNPSQITAPSVNLLCYKCHPEKRGPFMWEHQPVDENCSYCHTVHGSVHLRLVSEKIPNLCQSCHDTTRHPGTRYSAETLFTGSRITGSASSPSNRSFARSCLNCHSNIHGGNAPANPSNGYNSGAFFVR